MSPTGPTQEEIDSLALFLQATVELGNEPFFSRDEPRGLSKAGERMTFHLGDRCHFRSALITFRRIWIDGDREFFPNISKILRSYLTDEETTALNAVEQRIAATRKSKSNFGVQMSGSEVIELWLHAVFAHSGTSKQRQQFDQTIENYGHGAFEYTCRFLVGEIGRAYQEVAIRFVVPLLDDWHTRFASAPSFSMGSAFGTKRREKTKEGHLIIRKGSSEYFSEETYEQRFRRILGRYRNLDSSFQVLPFSDRELLKLVLKHNCFEAIVEESDFEIAIVEHVPDPQTLMNQPGPSNWVGLDSIGETNWSAIFFREDIATVNQDGLNILNALFQQFKAELIDA
ncbi:MAG: hypothetical protein ACREKL_14595 [Chthoniobacterales bacterium]